MNISFIVPRVEMVEEDREGEEDTVPLALVLGVVLSLEQAV